MEMQHEKGPVLVLEPEKPTNRQEYKNSMFPGSAIEELCRTEGLFNPKSPNLAIQHEKPEHRLILILKLQGLSNREIAAQTGYTEPWISQVCRQPWFQAQLVSELNKTGRDAVTEMLRIESPNNVLKLVELRDTAESEQVQLSATIRMLDQVLGKPVQKTEITGKFGHIVATVDQIDTKLKELEEEERKLLSA